MSRPVASSRGGGFGSAPQNVAYARVEGPAMFELPLAACPKAGFTPRLGEEAPRITSTLGLVATGLGIALVPTSVRRVHTDGVAYCDLMPGDCPAVPLQLVTRREPGSTVLRNFVDLARPESRV